MPRATVTKSIRLTPEEARDAGRLATLLGSASESALLKEALLRGMMEMKLEAAVMRYTHRDVSVGEVAEMFGVPVPVLLQELARRRIPTMDVPVEEFEANLRQLTLLHNLLDTPRRSGRRQRGSSRSTSKQA